MNLSIGSNKPLVCYTDGNLKEKNGFLESIWKSFVNNRLLLVWR